MISPSHWLEHLRNHLAVARAGDDPEGVHQLRVAAGRLSVWLELAGRRALRDDLAWLRRSASGVRDLDVLLARAKNECGKLGEWRGWLAAQRDEKRVQLVRVLDSPRLAALLAALSTLPPLAPAEADARLACFSRRVRRAASRLRAGAREEEKKHDAAALHRARRALRRWRYALEWTGADASEIKRWQEDLGELNDRAVLLRHLDASPIAAQLGELREETVRQLDARGDALYKRWRKHGRRSAR